MYLALIGDKKGIRPQLSAPIIPHGMYFPPLSSFTAVPTLVWEGHGWMALNRMYGEGESMRETCNPGLPGRIAVKPCVCVCVRINSF